MMMYDKFTQDNTYRILSESVWFCRSDDKKYFGVFFSVYSVYCEDVGLLAYHE